MQRKGSRSTSCPGNSGFTSGKHAEPQSLSRLIYEVNVESIFTKKFSCAKSDQFSSGMFGREVATALRQAKQVEAERRRQECLENERKLREEEKKRDEIEFANSQNMERHNSFAGLADMDNM